MKALKFIFGLALGLIAAPVLIYGTLYLIFVLPYANQ